LGWLFAGELVQQLLRGAAGVGEAHLANGALVILPIAGHVGTLLQAARAVVDLIGAFWHDPAATVAHHRRTTATGSPPAA
jgi:hypothetical protein